MDKIMELLTAVRGDRVVCRLCLLIALLALASSAGLLE